jgi:cyanate permease
MQIIKESRGYFRFLAVFFLLTGLVGAWGIYYAVQVSHFLVVAVLALGTASGFRCSFLMWQKAKIPKHG